MAYVAHIIELFGGVRRMAALIDRPVSTVQSWKVRGSIPDEHKLHILESGVALGIDLRPEHFFPGAATAPAPVPPTSEDAA